MKFGSQHVQINKTNCLHKKYVYHIRLINHTLLALPDKLLNTDYQLPIALCEYFFKVFKRSLEEIHFRLERAPDLVHISRLYFHHNCDF